MEGDGGNGFDTEAEDVVTNNTHNAVIVTLWTVASKWQSEMYASGDQIFRNKWRSARRNRNAERTQYVSYLTQGRDSECISQLRLNKNCFDLLCAVLRNRGLLADTRYVTVEEAIAEFLHTIAHNVRNRTNSFRFGRSGETISCHFHRVLTAAAQLAPDIIKQAGINTEGIPYFEDCVGAIDGTHVPVHIPLVTQGPFWNRKGTLSQNVMAACGFDLNFQYVHPGWEGSSSDARVLQSSLAHADPLHVPAGKFYLVDAGYANAPGFLAPYRGVRCHLSEHRGRNPQNAKELFNKRHSQARNVIERAFGILKSTFGILRIAPQYSMDTQVNIVTTCTVLHNFIRKHGGNMFDDELYEASEEGGEEHDVTTLPADDVHQNDQAFQVTQYYSRAARQQWSNFRDAYAARLWHDYTQQTTGQ